MPNQEGGTLAPKGIRLHQGSSACGPRASFVRPGKSISQNTMRYEILKLESLDTI